MTPIEKLIEKLENRIKIMDNYAYMTDEDKGRRHGYGQAIALLQQSLPAEREAIKKAFDVGYSLAMQQVGEKDREIERLKSTIHEIQDCLPITTNLLLSRKIESIINNAI